MLHSIPNAALNLVPNPATFSTVEFLASKGGKSIELPGSIATCIAGTGVWHPAL